MSLQWTLAAGFLYLEIFAVFILVLPFISPKKWQKLFKSRFLQVLSHQTQWYFGFIVLILTLFLLDAIREMRKYSNHEMGTDKHYSHLENELQTSMRLFRAQRNFYISGFSLFLSLVIRRLASLISSQATLMAENEAALKQAKSATSKARDLMASQGAGEAAQNSSNEAHQTEVSRLNDEITNLKDEMEKLIKDKEAVLSQAKSVEVEYDRLNEEHRKLQLKLKVQGGDEETKKDD